MSALTHRIRGLLYRGPLMPSGRIPGHYTRAEQLERDAWVDRQLRELAEKRHASNHHAPRHLGDSGAHR